jgi:hypothetical protein
MNNVNIETDFCYEDNNKICLGDIVMFKGMNKEGMIQYIKGAICVVFFDDTIPNILFYNMYIHEYNIIKAFHKISDYNKP